MKTFIIIITAVIFSAGGYWFSNENNKKVISDLENKYNSLVNSEKQKAQEEAEKISVCEIKKEEQKVDLPAIRFIPNTFSDSEKEELTKKVINPFIDFEKDSGVENKIISIAINKYSDSELAEKNDPKYAYRIDVIYKEGWGGWLEREIGDPIDYWIPDCLDGCEFSEDFKAKYPEVVEKYNAKQNPTE